MEYLTILSIRARTTRVATARKEKENTGVAECFFRRNVKCTKLQ